jgi:hypothetical protein
MEYVNLVSLRVKNATVEIILIVSSAKKGLFFSRIK